MLYRVLGTKTIEAPKASGYLSFLNALHPVGESIIALTFTPIDPPTLLYSSLSDILV